MKINRTITGLLTALVFFGISLAAAYAVGPGQGGAATITCKVSGNTLTMTWPVAGWTLQAQTNNLAKGLGSNWIDVPGSSSVTSITVTVNPANPVVFYRLRYP
jgi:hypothetical protein